LITVLMGAPGAGKTTWLKKNRNNEYVASTEAIRIVRDLDRDEFMASLRANGKRALQQGKSVIVDGTNTIERHRLYWLNVGKSLDHETRLISFDATLEKLLHAQTLRQYPAPYPVVVDHYKRFKLALKAIDQEGWDYIERRSR